MATNDGGDQQQQVVLLKEKADDLSRRGFHEEAIEIFGEAIKLKPNDSRLYINRGVCWYQLGNHEAALKDADKALEISPKSVIAIANKIDALEKLGGTDDSDKLFAQSCSIYPGFRDFFEKDACKRRTFDAEAAAFEELVLQQHQNAPWWRRALRYSATFWPLTNSNNSSKDHGKDLKNNDNNKQQQTSNNDGGSLETSFNTDAQQENHTAIELRKRNNHPQPQQPQAEQNV